jgi:hypothetical protein
LYVAGVTIRTRKLQLIARVRSVGTRELRSYKRENSLLKNKNTGGSLRGRDGAAAPPCRPQSKKEEQMPTPYGVRTQEEKQRLAAWTQIHKVHLSTSCKLCPHWLLGKRCAGWCQARDGYRFMDHVTGWLGENGKPAFVLCQPYPTGIDDTGRFEQEWPALEVHRGEPGWYGHGTVALYVRKRA